MQRRDADARDALSSCASRAFHPVQTLSSRCPPLARPIEDRVADPTPSQAQEKAASPAERTTAAPKAVSPTPSSAARFLEDLLLQSSRPEAESARPQAFLPPGSSYSAGHPPQRNPKAQAPPPPPQLPRVTSLPTPCSAVGSVFLACGSCLG